MLNISREPEKQNVRGASEHRVNIQAVNTAVYGHKRNYCVYTLQFIGYARSIECVGSEMSGYRSKRIQVGVKILRLLAESRCCDKRSPCPLRHFFKYCAYQPFLSGGIGKLFTVSGKHKAQPCIEKSAAAGIEYGCRVNGSSGQAGVLPYLIDSHTQLLSFNNLKSQLDRKLLICAFQAASYKNEPCTAALAEQISRTAVSKQRWYSKRAVNYQQVFPVRRYIY